MSNLLFIKKSPLTFVLICICTFGFTFYSQAQPTLPELGIQSKDGINILSWINPFESGVKSIKVERSADSTYNFTTIGIVQNTKNKTQSFIDAHPLLGPNWYRVVITFSSELEWISSLANTNVDSQSLANQKTLPTNDSLQKIIEQMGVSAINKLNTVSYPKSRFVFTNPFTGNINIEIPGVLQSTYSIIFFDQQKKKVLEIPRVLEETIILDKRNFQQVGLYSFKVFKNKEEFETGYITVY